MPSISLYKDVEVLIDVDLDEFDDEDLLDEIASRGMTVSSNSQQIITQIWQLRRTNQPYDHLMDELIYDTIGKLV